jgi:hypothetical protein
MKTRAALMRFIGGCFAYGGMAAFLCLIGTQSYRWFRDGEWTHIGISDGLRTVLTRCCVRDGDAGRLAALSHWLDAPVDWLGLHKALELIPASIALFLIGVLGNFVFIRGSDLLAAEKRGEQ